MGPLNRQRYRGMATIWLAIMGFALIGVVMLALDTGRVYFVGHQLQNTADAAALAGVNALPNGNTAARNAAQTIAYNNNVDGTPLVVDPNPSNAVTGDVVLGKYDKKTLLFTPTTSNANACKVVARRPAVALILGGMFGTASSNVSRNAIAYAEPGEGPGLILLSPHDKDALSLKGGANARINVIGSGIQVNSDNAQAVNLQGVVQADVVNVVGNGSINKIQGTPPPINFGKPVLEDPLANVPRIDPSQYASSLYGGDRTATPATQVILEPGYYKNGLPGGVAHQLNPGIYILGGTGASAGSYTTNGSGGVLLYLLTPSAGSSPKLGTNLTIRAPNPELGDTFYGADIYRGIGVYQEKTGAKTVTQSYSGSPNVNIRGTVYMPDTHLTANGDLSQFGTQLMLWSLDLQGSTSLTISVDDAFGGPVSNQIYLIK